MKLTITVNGETTEYSIDKSPEHIGICKTFDSSNDARERLLCEMDRHYQSIGGTCKYDENGHVCWNSIVGMCGSSTIA